ncbi:MAG: glycerol-3-phosphate acyltransferase [Actinobacteria bacterium]|nr:glycerol-3-phosphate acyltransferase [Actinomycetota bacterium]
MSDRERRSRTSHRLVAVAAICAAFALGCFPSAGLVSRFCGGRSITELGNGNPGAANVRRHLGMRAALLVGALDIFKGWLPARLGRWSGASDSLVGPLAMAPIAGHILVLGGRGAAAAVGAASAYDPSAMAITGAGIIWGSKKYEHAPAVMAGGFAYPAIQWILGCSREHVAWGAGIIALLSAGRLKGPRRGARPLSGRVLWERLWFDREPAD